MTAIIGFRRLGFIISALIAIMVAVFAGASYLVSADVVRRQTMQEIRATTGLDAILRGQARVSLFPTGSVSFADVVLGDPGHPALTAGRLTARLRFFPMLIGRVQIADISLERPTIIIDVARNGQSNWSGLIDALAKSQRPEASEATAFSEIRIKNGTVVLRNPARHISEVLEEVEFSLAWPSISKSFGASGRFVWHEEPVDASLTLGDFRAALTGARSGLKLRLSARPIKAAFEGAMSIKPTLKVEGALAAEAASLRDAVIWSGHQSLPGGGFGHFAIKAQAGVVDGTIGLSGVNIELDGNAAEGVLTFATNGRRNSPGHTCGGHARSFSLPFHDPSAYRQSTCLERRTDRA